MSRIRASSRPPEGVIVIDSGSNAAFAEHMLQAIRARTGKPLAMVILTQPVDGAIFGATVLQRHGGPVLAARGGGEAHGRALRDVPQEPDERARRGRHGRTRLPRPDRVFKGSQRLTVAGRSLELLDYSGAAAPGSIAVWDRASGILFAGGLASFERIPETRDGALDDWIKALRELAKRPARAIVPAHGPIGNRASLESLAAYLSALDRRTAQVYAARLSLVDAPRVVAVPEYKGWALYESVHPRNVHHAYLARERRELAKP